MNKYILTVIDNILNTSKYNKKNLDQNAAYDAKNAAYAAAADAAAYAYAAKDAAKDAADAYSLNEYFKLSGENKQDYIDAINKEGNRQACPHKQ